MLTTTNVDELIYLREQARLGRNWKLSDEIRNYLDTQLVFVFDAPSGQEIHYLTEKYFKRKPEDLTYRKYVEFKIQEDIRIEKIFDGWLFSTRNGK